MFTSVQVDTAEGVLISSPLVAKTAKVQEKITRSVEVKVYMVMFQGRAERCLCVRGEGEVRLNPKKISEVKKRVMIL